MQLTKDVIILCHDFHRSCILLWKTSSVSTNNGHHGERLFFLCIHISINVVTGFDSFIKTFWSHQQFVLSYLSSSFVCKIYVVSLRYMQINCLGFSFLRLGTNTLQCAELMDAALQQYQCCYSQIEIFGCLGLHFHIHMQILTTGFQMASSLRKLCFK